MDMAIIAVIPQYVITPFWFFMVLGVCALISEWMYRREKEKFDRDKMRSIGPGAGWAILAGMFKILTGVALFWLVIAGIVRIISS